MFKRDDIISFLLDHGVPIDTRDAQSSTPFLDAVAAGQTKCAQLLLQKGADIKTSDIHMKNCIHMAVENEYLETLLMLLKQSSVLWNLYRPDVTERVPLHYAAMVKDVRVRYNSNVSFKTALLGFSLRSDIPNQISLEAIAATKKFRAIPIGRHASTIARNCTSPTLYSVTKISIKGIATCTCNTFNRS